jgi:hypothetical protein
VQRRTTKTQTGISQRSSRK